MRDGRDGGYLPLRDYALIRTALHLQKAEALGAEERAGDAAERAGHVEGAKRVTRPES